MSTSRKVLIVGGGIGGLSAALSLRQAGLEADIVELKQDWTVYGVGIIQPSNQLRALGEIGLAKACMQAGGAFPGWQFCDSSGGVLAEVPTLQADGSHYPANNGISRPALHQILVSSARNHDVPVRLGVTVAALDNRSDGVTVEFTDGTKDDYDLVIGADGTYSKIRSMVFGASVRPTYNGESVWRYNFPRPESLVWGQLLYGRASKAGLVPMSPTSMYLLLVTPEPGNPRMPAEHLHELMRDRMKEYTGLVGELREQITDSAAVVYKPMEPLLVPDPWYRNCVLLIGDAAHSTTPHMAQGASMAIEDAVLLGPLLSQRRPLSELLQEFMRRRYKRCQLVVEASSQIGLWEMAEWSGHPDPDADPASLMAEAGAVMSQTY